MSDEGRGRSCWASLVVSDSNTYFCTRDAEHEGDHAAHGRTWTDWSETAPARTPSKSEDSEPGRVRSCTGGPDCPVEGHEMTLIPGMGPEEGRGLSPCEDARDHRFSVQQAFLAGACTVLAVLSLLALADLL